MTIDLHYITSDLQHLHMALDAILAALVWGLYRRNEQARQRLRALENEQGLARKRVEAATGGLHIRLLQLERRMRQPAATATPAAGNVRGEVYSIPRVILTSDGKIMEGRTTPLVAAKPRLSRGEIDLLRKIRRLSPAPKA